MLAEKVSVLEHNCGCAREKLRQIRKARAIIIKLELRIAGLLTALICWKHKLYPLYYKNFMDKNEVRKGCFDK